MDASALIARFRGEAGADRVDALIDGSCVSAVNLSELVQRLADLGASEDLVGEILRRLPCRVEAFDADMALAAGLLRRPTKAMGLSLGDRACLALARRLGWPAVTADRAWAELDLGIEVVLIR